MRNAADVLNEKPLNDVIMDLVGYLVYAEQYGDNWGDYNPEKALESVQCLLGYDNEQFEKLKQIFRT